MQGSGIVTIFIIVITLVFSYRGLLDKNFFDKYRFNVDKVLLYKEYHVLITSGLLHVSWLHLFFNMLTLFIFSESLEAYLGPLQFALIYIVSLVGGNLLALFIHRRHGDYSAVGASGAVNGIVFASIALFPGMHIGFFILPVSIPAWVYGLAFFVFSIYGVRSNRDNVGHEAHLGGALIGMMTALIMEPAVITVNYIPILLVTVPGIGFILFIIFKPQALLVDNLYFKRHFNYTIDQRYNLAQVQKQNELDRILDKINRKGMKSLTKEEKQKLEQLSK